jgi:hypothetical protein
MAMTMTFAALQWVAATSARAQAYGTTTDAETAANGINFDCIHEPQNCGNGDHSSSSGRSTSSGISELGHSSGTTFATGKTPGGWNSSAFVDVRWWDTFTITSSLLPTGTPVTVNLSFLFDYDGLGAGDPSDWQTRAAFAYGGPDAGLFGAQAGYQSVPANSYIGLYTFSFTQHVGQSFKLVGVTQANAHAENFTSGSVEVHLNVETRFFVDLGGVVAASTQPAGASMQSAEASVASMDAVSDLRMVTASGHEYSTQPSTTVPEPGTLALMGVGLLGAALSTRRTRGLAGLPQGLR